MDTLQRLLGENEVTAVVSVSAEAETLVAAPAEMLNAGGVPAPDGVGVSSVFVEDVILLPL